MKEKEYFRSNNKCKAVKLKEFKICDRCGWFMESGSNALKWSSKKYTHMVCRNK